MPNAFAIFSEPEAAARVERSGAPELSYEERLELSRRLDWRFLLVDPRLANVACVGSCDALLQRALRHFSPSTVFLASLADVIAEPHKFDVVIVKDITPALMTAAAARVRPGGALYMELNRSLFSPVKWFRSPERVASSLPSLGFIDVQMHWHWPSFLSATSLLPIHNGDAALGYFLNYQSGSLRGWVKSILGRAALACGWRNILPRCVSVVGRKDGP